MQKACPQKITFENVQDKYSKIKKKKREDAEVVEGAVGEQRT